MPTIQNINMLRLLTWINYSLKVNDFILIIPEIRLLKLPVSRTLQHQLISF